MSNDRGFQSIRSPLRAGDEEDLLEALAARKGIGRLQSPEGSEPPPLAPRRQTAEPEPQKATSRDRVKSMNLELPDYVMRALKELALNENCSVRHIIMRSLLKEGIEINPADMIADGRRLRGKNALQRG